MIQFIKLNFFFLHKVSAFHCKFLKICLGSHVSEDVMQFINSAYSDLEFSFLCLIHTAALATFTSFGTM